MDSDTRKYPRTFHLPFSPGVTKDDKIAKDVSALFGLPLLISEKMDGSNVCMTRDELFARSHSGPPSHPSFDLLKAQHSAIRYAIPTGIEVYGEWLYARHSIAYDKLPTYLQVFGVRDGTIWWSWEDTKEMANELGVATVPAILQGVVIDSLEELKYKIEVIAVHNLFKPACGLEREGFVVRPERDFIDAEFPETVFKWVRKNHVQTSDHWKHQTLIPNVLGNT